MHLLHQLGDYEHGNSTQPRRAPQPPSIVSQQTTSQPTVIRRMAPFENHVAPYTPMAKGASPWSPRTPSDQTSYAGESYHPSSTVTRRPPSKRGHHRTRAIRGSGEQSELALRLREDVSPPPPSSTLRLLPPPPPPTEATLLRELPFTLQGLSSTSLQFEENGSLRLPSSLPPPVLSLLHVLAEPSLLYRELSAFTSSSEGGLIGQSLRAAIEGELCTYLEWVSTLEGRIRRALAELDNTSAGSRAGLGKTGISLKRCVVWAREATMKLRLMAVMVAESKRAFFSHKIACFRRSIWLTDPFYIYYTFTLIFFRQERWSSHLPYSQFLVIPW